MSHSPNIVFSFTKLLSHSRTWFYSIKLSKSHSPNFTLVRLEILRAIWEICTVWQIFNCGIISIYHLQANRAVAIWPTYTTQTSNIPLRSVISHSTASHAIWLTFVVYWMSLWYMSHIATASEQNLYWVLQQHVFYRGGSESSEWVPRVSKRARSRLKSISKD